MNYGGIIKMPNLDGTGPDGKGPLTGKGFGNCKGAKPCPRGRMKGLGRGRGLGRRLTVQDEKQ